MRSCKVVTFTRARSGVTLRALSVTIEEEEEEEASEHPPVLRIESNKDSAESGLPVSTTTSLRDSLWNSNYESNWDQLFVEENGDTSGMDHLLGLMGEFTQAESLSHEDADPSALSQRAQGLFRELTDRMDADATTVEAMTMECPHWHENIAFALAQTDQKDVVDALQNVQVAKSRLQTLKEEFLAKLERQAHVLDVFEHALQISSTRFEGMSRDSTVDIAVEADGS